MTAAEFKRKKLEEFRQAYLKAKKAGTQKPIKAE